MTAADTPMPPLGPWEVDDETLAYLRRLFNDDALRRLAVCRQPYYSTHGEYVPALAKLLLAEKKAWAAAVSSVSGTPPKPLSAASGAPDGKAKP